MIKYVTLVYQAGEVVLYKQIASIQKPLDYQAMVLQPSITNYTPLFLVSIYARAG